MDLDFTDKELDLLQQSVSFLRKFTSEEADLMCELGLFPTQKTEKLNKELENLSQKLTNCE